ncbi:DUF3455 domain-containing protein [Sphaerotilus sp.]|uniref:DUF3455 domain-containing protein n=1 Tax=Sphaerotilus sp. TaxID=2093942 RepID=UPI00286DBAD3|nr:DUF3455 domain-containing protein [Sphaerotilus sp.]
MNTKLILSAAAVALLSACASSGPMTPMMPFSQMALPDAVKVPDGHKVAMETVGAGEITYECRVKAGTGTVDQMEWFFVGPAAGLKDRSGKMVGSYYGPPATWQSADGSKLTGMQVAVAPASAGNIPHQLVKANPAMGAGAMTGVSYIQRTATRGGVAPSQVCAASNAGQRITVQYQADYIFWTPA